VHDVPKNDAYSSAELYRIEDPVDSSRVDRSTRRNRNRRGPSYAIQFSKSIAVASKDNSLRYSRIEKHLSTAFCKPLQRSRSTEWILANRGSRRSDLRDALERASLGRHVEPSPLHAVAQPEALAGIRTSWLTACA